MMGDKNSFLLYKNWGKSINKLSDEEAGKLIKSIFTYVQGREKTEFDELATEMIFDIIVDSLERDLEKYKKTVKRNQENGKKGGRPRKPEVITETQNNPVGFKESEGLKKIPKKADIDNDNGIDNVNDIDNVKDKDIEEPLVGNKVSNNSQSNELIKEVVNHLNLINNSKYKHTTDNTRKHIKARINDGYTFDDFKLVIEYKVYEWKNDEKMRKFIRPETLFGSKFESYLQNAHIALQKNADSNQSIIDEIMEMKELERRIKNGEI